MVEPRVNDILAVRAEVYYHEVVSECLLLFSLSKLPPLSQCTIKCNCRPVKTARSGLVAPLEDGDMLLDEFVRKTIVSLGLWIVFSNMGKPLVPNPVRLYK